MGKYAIDLEMRADRDGRWLLSVERDRRRPVAVRGSVARCRMDRAKKPARLRDRDFDSLWKRVFGQQKLQ
jgi:hypothetical protein